MTFAGASGSCPGYNFIGSNQLIMSGQVVELRLGNPPLRNRRFQRPAEPLQIVETTEKSVLM